MNLFCDADGPVLSTSTVFVATQLRPSGPLQVADPITSTLATAMISASSSVGMSRPDQIVQCSSSQSVGSQMSACGEVGLLVVLLFRTTICYVHFMLHGQGYSLNRIFNISNFAT